MILVYRKFVGKPLYLTVSSPDITYAVHHLSQFLQAPRMPHMVVVQRVSNYLKPSSFKGLFYPSSSTLQLEVFYDSDWGSSLDSSEILKSITGMYLMLGSSFVV